MTEPTKLHECAERLKIGVKAEFVPFSQSRNKAKKTPSLNWRVTLTRDGRDILTTDYGAGQGHCPASKRPPKLSNGAIDKYLQRKRIGIECERGKVSRARDGNYAGLMLGAPILPDECDVIYSLARDSDVLDYSSFEEWAENFGYDADSRSAEKIYQACLAIALQLRNGLGETVLAELQAACQDY
jgi:hypothetical protein